MKSDEATEREGEEKKELCCSDAGYPPSLKLRWTKRVTG